MNDKNEKESILERASQNIKKYQKMLNPFIETIRSNYKYKKKEEKAFLESGWWIPPSLLNVEERKINRAVKSFHNGQKEAINDLFIDVYESNDCDYLKQTVARWEGNSYFKPWEEHIQNSLKAHVNKNYISSVPNLLIIAEGVATKYCRDKNIYKNKDKANGRRVINKTVKYDYSLKEHILYSDLDLFKEALTYEIFESTDKIKNKLQEDILNRHAIMHGLKADYGTLKQSLQGFIILDMLSNIE